MFLFVFFINNPQKKGFKFEIHFLILIF